MPVVGEASRQQVSAALQPCFADVGTRRAASTTLLLTKVGRRIGFEVVLASDAAASSWSMVMLQTGSIVIISASIQARFKS